VHRIADLAGTDRILRGTKDVLRRMMKRYDLAASSRAVRLGIEAVHGEPIDFSLPKPSVHDGLEKLIGMGAKIPARSATSESDVDYPRVLRAYLIVSSGRVGSAPLKITVSAYVGAPDLIRLPGVRAPSTLTIEAEPNVRTVTILPEHLGVRDASARTRFPEPLVRDRTTKIAAYPFIRVGVDVERVEPEEREGFLREAESLKGVPYGQGELLALFRNVPVELIAKAHYSDEKKVLLYTVDGAGGCASTRVHDLAVVRDTVAGKKHMIVHRRQFKSVRIA